MYCWTKGADNKDWAPKWVTRPILDYEGKRESRIAMNTCKPCFTFSIYIPTQSDFLSYLSPFTALELTIDGGGASDIKITYAKMFYFSSSTKNYHQFHLNLHKFSRSSKNKQRTLDTKLEIKWWIGAIKVPDVRDLIPRLSVYMMVTRMHQMIEKIKTTCQRKWLRSEQNNV